MRRRFVRRRGRGAFGFAERGRDVAAFEQHPREIHAKLSVGWVDAHRATEGAERLVTFAGRDQRDAKVRPAVRILRPALEKRAIVGESFVEVLLGRLRVGEQSLNGRVGG